MSIGNAKRSAPRTSRTPGRSSIQTSTVVVSAGATTLRPRYPQAVSEQPSTAEMFALMSWRDRRMAALCQAGMVEKFVDALVWAFWPVYLHQRGVDLPGIGWIVGVYGFTWGAALIRW